MNYGVATEPHVLELARLEEQATQCKWDRYAEQLSREEWIMQNVEWWPMKEMVRFARMKRARETQPAPSGAAPETIREAEER